MSNDVGEVRRGGRSRKQVDRFEPPTANKGKNKAVDNEDESDDESDADSDDTVQASRPARKRMSNANGTKKGKSLPAPKKSRTKNVTVNVNATTEVASEEFKVDSPFFNAMLSSDIALAPLVEEWVENYQQTANDETSEKSAVHELVLFIVRACGLAVDVDEDEAMDVDGVGDVIERIQEESLEVSAAAYPLISRGKTLKPFKGNLDFLISHLIKTMAISGILYQQTDTTSHTIPLISIINTWLNTMITSPLRPIRHTATYIGIKIVTELCNQAGDVSKELSLKQRQKDMEAKKGGSGQAYQKRLKDVENKVKEVHENKTRLEELMKESFDTMFVHRVRDADANIRTDCLRELGIWVKKYPDLYTGSSFLQYLTRGTSDPNAHTRLEAVKAFTSLLSKETFVNNARTSIMRVSTRLIEISLRDVDVNVRINALKALALLDKTGVLQDEDDEQRQQVVRVVFDQDPRIRRAVGDYVKGLLDEAVEALESKWSSARPTKKKRAAKINDNDMEDYLRWKAFATMMVSTYHELDIAKQSEPGTSANTVSATMGRATAVVEALRNQITGLAEWDGLVDYLLLDHSTAVDDMWLLEDEEEDFMLQILIACIQAAAEDDAETRDEQTKALIKVYPRLLSKHQADVGRMSGLLTIPSQMNLGLYLDMRMTQAYETLWDHITKQFLQHTDVTVLTAAIQAINQLNLNTSLSTSNTAKLDDLTEALFSSLRDAVDGRDVASMTIDEDEIAKLEAVMLRLSLLGKSRDITEAMEDEEGGQSSGWEIVCAFAGRGDLPYRDEAKMVDYAIQVVFLHLAWLFKNFTIEDKDDAMKVAALEEKRNRAIEIFSRLALKEMSNATVSVKRQAFIAYVNTHILFSPKSPTPLPAAQACPLVIESETQHRLGGAFQAVVERYASDKETAEDEDEDRVANAEEEMTPEKAEAEILFLQLVAVFVGAIRCGVLDSDHAKEPLAHCGRFGATYDAIARKLVDVLRDEGIYNRESDTVVAVSTEALQSSFNVFLDTDEMEPKAPMILTKILASAFTIHGSHFTVLKHLHPSDAESFHTVSIQSTFRKIANYVKQERVSKVMAVKQRYALKRAQCLSIFKCLILLLGPVVGKGALAIKASMTEALDMAGVEVSPNRMWEPLRAYEKRLILIASKDVNIRAGASRIMREAERAEEEEGTELGTERSPSPTPHANGVNGKTAGSQSLSGNGNGNEIDINNEDVQDEEEVVVEEEDPVEDEIEAEIDLDLELDGPELDFDLGLDLPGTPASSVGVGAGARVGRKRSGTILAGATAPAGKRTRR